MATVDELINDIITNALAQSDTYLGKLDTSVQAAINESHGYAHAGTSLVDFSVTAIEPAVPAVGDATLTYEAQLAQLISLLSGQLAAFFALYYPLAADAFDEATNWLVNAITVGGTGIPAAIEEQIWQRGRTRVITEGKRVENQSISEFANRGFTLPPGALAGRLQEVRFAQLGENSDYSAQTAIKAAQIEIENIRFAVEQAIKSRLAAMAAAVDYIRALMAAPDAAARVAMINSDAQARMMSATADLYRARLTRDELILRSSNADQDAKVALNKIDIDGFYEGIRNRVQAAVGAANAYGSAASAALQSLNTVAATNQIAL